MRSYYFTMALVIFLLATLLSGCGKTPATAKFVSEQSLGTKAQLTEMSPEDRMIAALPYEERLAYLLERYKQLVWELHGVRVENNPSDRQVATGDDYAHKVAPRVDQNTLREDMKLTQTENKWEWRLSFLERLTGDYNFDHVVGISDITPLAIHMGETVGQYPEVAHIDRNGNDDGVIGVQDVTQLAQNFGKTITGYEVYWRDDLGGEPRLLTVWNVPTNRSPETYRDKWMDAIGLHPPVPFTRKGIYDRTQPNPILVALGDTILVRPMFGTTPTPSQIDSEEVPFTLDLTRQQTIPVAAISASNTNPRRNQIIQLDGSASTDADSDALSFEWDVNGAYGGWHWTPTPGLNTFNTVYTSAGTYEATVRVTDSVGDWDTEDVTITVQSLGLPVPPVFDNPQPYVSPSSGTVPFSVQYEIAASDPEGAQISQIAINLDGDGVGDTGWDKVSPTDFAINFYDNAYHAGYTWNIQRSDLEDDVHTTYFTSRCKATDNDSPAQSSWTNVTPTIAASHASPVAALTASPTGGFTEAGELDDPVDIDFDASTSSDADGSIVSYTFDFGDESTPLIDADGICSHSYDEPGTYDVTVTVYDNDHEDYGGQCEEIDPEVPLHYSTATATITVIGPPALVESPRELDDGSRTSGPNWTTLGNPCIAVDIAENGTVGVLYYAVPAYDPPSLPKTAPFIVEKYLGVWGLPVMVYGGLVDAASYIGEQCDLMYQPGSNLAYVAATKHRLAGEVMPEYWGIQLYTATGIPCPDAAWMWMALGPDFDPDVYQVNTGVPLRLVVNLEGEFIHHYVSATEFDGLMEIFVKGNIGSSDYGLLPVETDCGTTYDQKPHNGIVENTRRTGTAYQASQGSQVGVTWEKTRNINLLWDWYGTEVSGDKEIVAPPAPLAHGSNTRSLSLDYWKHLEGLIWHYEKGVLYKAFNNDLALRRFREVGGPETVWMATDIGNYCDFDYAQFAGCPSLIAAYEKEVNGDMMVYARMLFDTGGGSVMCDEIEIDNLGEGGISHLDMDISEDGYAYIAYSKNNDIYCATLDLLNRP